MAAPTLLKRKLEETQDQHGAEYQSYKKKRNVHGKSKHNSTDLPKPELQTEPQPQLERVDGVQVGTAQAEDVSVQIVVASYDRVLHGITTTIPLELIEPDIGSQAIDTTERDDHQAQVVTFTDTFLLAAHTSSIRCLALSPPTGSNKRLLATGSSDERINLYSISTIPSRTTLRSNPPSFLSTSRATSENPSNRPLGSLNHHSRPVTTLHFPSKSKLCSSSEDNTMAVTRTRDWTVLSTIKAPIPKAVGRPSGDTSAPGEVPAGVNDFAVHPSQKLMISVGRGEKCMRLWNLMTGKKAGALQFDRDLLAQVGEGKLGRGEGTRVLWNESGEYFVVGFERGAVVFGVDSKARAVVLPVPERTKVQRMRFLPKTGRLVSKEVLAVSTENGRILFYELPQPDDGEGVDGKALPRLRCLAQLGGQVTGVTNRIKDFEVLVLPQLPSMARPPLLVVTANSDGAVRVWSLPTDALAAPQTNGQSEEPSPRQVGRLLGTVETGNRITCLGAFVMDSSDSASKGEVGKNDIGTGGSDESASERDEIEDDESFEGLG